jgi:hypothetical protein
MEIIHLVKKISILTAAPILLMLAIVVIIKLLIPALQKLTDKSFRIIDKQSTQPKPIGRYGRLVLGSFKIMIGYILFIVFLQMFSLPLYFIPALKWEPPVVIVLLLAVMAMLFSGFITYKLMQVVNKYFNR